MTSGVERDEYIGQLRAAGWSAIEIAEEVGLSRSQVHRILAVVGDAARGDLANDDGDDPWTDDVGAVALLDAEDDYQPVGPFRFVGLGERSEERFLDGNGRSCSMLDIWRSDFDGGSEDKGYLADAQSQIEAAGYRRVDNGDGRWRWER
jgi:hypothetical protein